MRQRKCPRGKFSKICIFTNYAIRTKKDQLNNVINDWEQRLIVMSNQDAKSHMLQMINVV